MKALIIIGVLLGASLFLLILRLLIYLLVKYINNGNTDY
jgi:hypothetical protein